MSLERIKGWFRRSTTSVEDAVDAGEPVATPPAGAGPAWKSDPDRETSTNAQMEGAADEPWPGNT
jgi:hypothetical protein